MFVRIAGVYRSGAGVASGYPNVSVAVEEVALRPRVEGGVDPVRAESAGPPPVRDVVRIAGVYRSGAGVASGYPNVSVAVEEVALRARVQRGVNCHSILLLALQVPDRRKNPDELRPLLRRPSLELTSEAGDPRPPSTLSAALWSSQGSGLDDALGSTLGSAPPPRPGAPVGASNYGFGPIAFPCDKTTAGPGTTCGSGQETQILGRQGHPRQGCRAWLHHAGDVQDARVLFVPRNWAVLVTSNRSLTQGPTGCRPTSISRSQSKMGGHRTVDNAVLAHRLCNRIDYPIRVWRSYGSDLERVRKAREAAAGS